MGVIDDYYGGYENLWMWTDENGDVDYEGAYEAASGLGPELPEWILRGEDPYADEYDDYDDLYDKITRSTQAYGTKEQPPVDDPAVLRRLLAVLKGNFTATALTSSLEFGVGCTEFRETQDTRGGSFGTIAYEREASLLNNGPIYAAIDQEMDFNEATGIPFSVTWWDEAGRPRQEDKNLEFLTLNDLRTYHMEFRFGNAYKAGPKYPGWCALLKPGFHSKPGSKVHWEVFWSSAVLWWAIRTTGVKPWDEAMHEMSTSEGIADLKARLREAEAVEADNKAKLQAEKKAKKSKERAARRESNRGGKGGNGGGKGTGTGRGQGSNSTRNSDINADEGPNGSSSSSAPHQVAASQTSEAEGQGRGKNYEKNRRRREKKRMEQQMGGLSLQ